MQPNAGLPVGPHTATVTATGDNHAPPQSFTVSFTVHPGHDYSHFYTSASTWDGLRMAIQNAPPNRMTFIRITGNLTTAGAADGNVIFVSANRFIVLESSAPGVRNIDMLTRDNRHFVVTGSLTLGNGITLRGGTTAANTNNAGGVHINSSGNLTMNTGSTIQWVNRTGTTWEHFGGAVNIAGIGMPGGRFTMNGGWIQHNSAYRGGGGGVYLSGGTVVVQGGTIGRWMTSGEGNSAHRGGGVYISSGTFTMGGVGAGTRPSGGRIQGNMATDPSIAGGGGGIFQSGGTVNIVAGTIGDNTAPHGGGVRVTTTAPNAFTMTGGTLSNNRATAATGDGGAIFAGTSSLIANPLPADSKQMLDIRAGVSFSGNSAGAGRFTPPSNAATATQILATSSSVAGAGHPLNNYDINFGNVASVARDVRFNSNLSGTNALIRHNAQTNNFVQSDATATFHTVRRGSEANSRFNQVLSQLGSVPTRDGHVFSNLRDGRLQASGGNARPAIANSYWMVSQTQANAVFGGWFDSMENANSHALNTGRVSFDHQVPDAAIAFDAHARWYPTRTVHFAAGSGAIWPEDSGVVTSHATNGLTLTRRMSTAETNTASALGRITAAEAANFHQLLSAIHLVRPGVCVSDVGGPTVEPIRPGYIFDGWRTAPNGGGLRVESATLQSGLTWTSNAITLHAQWSPTPVGTWDELREAVNVAPANELHTIHISSNLTTASAMNGNAINIPAGRNIVLESSEAEIRHTVDMLTNEQRHFTVSGQLTLGAGITLRGGTTAANANNAGGVQVNSGGTLTMLEDSAIQWVNRTGLAVENLGGAISLNGFGTDVETRATFVMDGGVIHNNAADRGGDVNVQNNAHFSMHGGVIRDNRATGTLVGGGGIFQSRGTVYISGGEISNNTASRGGGVHVATYTPNAFTVTGGTLRDNRATDGDGGAIFAGFSTLTAAQLPTDSLPMLDIRADVMFSDNSASEGWFTPPTNARTATRILTSSSSVAEANHPLNNYDVNFRRYDQTVTFNPNGGVFVGGDQLPSRVVYVNDPYNAPVWTYAQAIDGDGNLVNPDLPRPM